MKMENEEKMKQINPKLTEKQLSNLEKLSNAGVMLVNPI